MPEPTPEVYPPDTELEKTLRGRDRFAVPMIQRKAAEELRRLRIKIADLEIEVLVLKEIIMSRGPSSTTRASDEPVT